ncbi:HXXEE domain-containing protein [Paenibacillus sp. GYB003]|uniref:HXXEE domain-containing protein n=1 Tax=Paenibacillus sp. GYB003 TaxID=2994392 RepID=UPI002F96C7CC
MLSTIAESSGLEALIWLLPIVFFIHDGEEIATVEKWLRNNKAHPRIAAERRLIDWDKNVTVQFATAVLLLGSALMLAAYFAAKSVDGGGPAIAVFTGAVAVLLLDGIKHVGISVALGTYTSGVITAALVEIPYAAYALYRFCEAGAANFATIATGFAFALPATLIFVWGGLSLGKTVAPYRKRA